jgi:hypothetical protein
MHVAVAAIQKPATAYARAVAGLIYQELGFARLLESMLFQNSGAFFQKSMSNVWRI